MAQPTNQKEAISNLQRYLRRLSYGGLEGDRAPIDGIFDTATRNALIRFQQSVGLPETGIADKLTWDTLFDEYSRAVRSEKESLGLFIFPSSPKNYEVSPGEAWLLVNMIQLLLLELRAVYGIFEDITESGVYDKATEDAIREFQRINLLPETGRVDETTWNRIVREYSNLSSQ